MLSPNAKLDWKMGNLTLHRSAQEGESNSDMAHPRPDIKSLAWKLANEPHFGLDKDDEEEEEDEESDDSDGMFHGLFYLGSKILTEVEMQSPVEESKIIVTPIRTPRRSNNSSRASSTRELDFGSSQVCSVESESCFAFDAIAVASPCQHPTQSMPPFCIKTSSPCCKEAKSAMMPHEQMDHSLTVSSIEGSSAMQDRKSVLGEFTPLYKHEGQDCKRDDESEESDRVLDEANLQPSLEPSRDGKLFSQKQTVWNDRKCQVTVGSSSPECCKTVNPSLKQGKSACAFKYRGAGKYAVVPEGEIPVGSLPDGSKSNISSRGWRKENKDRRQARSLTDEDFNELRGCIDLGFVFTQDHIPDLCETLPALEVCYAIAHGPISPVCNLEDSKSFCPGSPPFSPWKVASPGDQPQQVKTRLRHWAQAVACNVRQGC